MYDVALFGHVLGAVLLVSAVMMTVTGLLRSQRASTNAQVRSAMGGVPVADRLIPPAMALLLAFGLYMVARHGGDDSIAWTSGWVDTALAVFAVMSVLGPAVEAKRSKRLYEAAAAAPDGPVSEQVDRLRRDPVLTHVTLFGASEIVALLYLMTNRPGLVGALGSVLGAALISVALGRAALHVAATTAAPAASPPVGAIVPPVISAGNPRRLPST